VVALVVVALVVVLLVGAAVLLGAAVVVLHPLRTTAIPTAARIDLNIFKILGS
jgi:hypothetical protein